MMESRIRLLKLGHCNRHPGIGLSSAFKEANLKFPAHAFVSKGRVSTLGPISWVHGTSALWLAMIYSCLHKQVSLSTCSFNMSLRYGMQ